ncbi:MAG TPA: hypothetical protein VF715_12460 [Thermoleophilaceae bacterium]|jgi:Tol biopolymer transport system component
MDSRARTYLAIAAAATALLAAAPASASFPGKNGLLTYTAGEGYRDGTTSIWGQRLSGAAPHELLAHEDSAGRTDVQAVSDEEASWAPSGKRYAFARRTGGGNLRLFVTEAGMKSARAIPLPEGMAARSPAFAPDGRTIVFVEVISGGDPAEEVTYEAGWNLWRVRTDGTGLRKLRAGDRPAWSPRGGLIAFQDSCGSLKTMRTDGSRVRTVVAATRVNGVCRGVGAPEFAPSGGRIAFAALNGNGSSARSEIFTVGTDGRGRRRVTTTPGAGAAEPAWSPDGQSIAFHRDTGKAGGSGLYRVPAGGGNPRRITGAFVQDLDWQPLR